MPVLGFLTSIDFCVFPFTIYIQGISTPKQNGINSKQINFIFIPDNRRYLKSIIDYI